MRHHAELLRQPAALHELLLAVVPVVDQLRSQTVRVALLLIQEMFGTLGRALDRELDDVVPLLLKRAGEVRCCPGSGLCGIRSTNIVPPAGTASPSASCHPSIHHIGTALDVLPATRISCHCSLQHHSIDDQHHHHIHPLTYPRTCPPPPTPGLHSRPGELPGGRS